MLCYQIKKGKKCRSQNFASEPFQHFRTENFFRSAHLVDAYFTFAVLRHLIMGGTLQVVFTFVFVFNCVLR